MIAKSTGARVTLLSGDVHLAAVARTYTWPKVGLLLRKHGIRSGGGRSARHDNPDAAFAHDFRFICQARFLTRS